MNQKTAKLLRKYSIRSGESLKVIKKDWREMSEKARVSERKEMEKVVSED